MKNHECLPRKTEVRETKVMVKKQKEQEVIREDNNQTREKNKGVEHRRESYVHSSTRIKRRNLMAYR